MQSTSEYVVLESGSAVITLTIAICVVVLVAAIAAARIVIKNKKDKRTKE